MIRSQIRKMETMPELSQQDYVHIHECHIFQNVFKYKRELFDNFGDTMVSEDLPVVSPMNTKPRISENTEARLHNTNQHETPCKYLSFSMLCSTAQQLVKRETVGNFM